MVKRWAVMLAAAAAPLVAHAQAVVIAGGVYEDRQALALRTSFVPVAGASVKLYRDGGDGQPSADDAKIAATSTSAAGDYGFPVDRAGMYWVAVDSRTVGKEGLWADQTFGPGGSLCARPDGSSARINFEGACVGGRTANADDASALTTSEHVAGVAVRNADVKAVDFAFSFDAVTSTVDGDHVQGSLRQFVINANAQRGPNRMRFIPLTRAPEQREVIIGLAPRWWTMILGSPLPALRDGDTIIDGTAYNFLSPATISNVHEGRVGDQSSFKIDRSLEILHPEKPELELVLTGAEGIVCESRCAIRSLAVRGAPLAIALRADAQLDHLMVGAVPDGEDGARGTYGIQIERGTTVARHVLVTAQSNVGILVGPEGRLDGERLDVSRCGEPTSGGGIVLLSNGSAIRMSTINSNSGAGIVLGAPDGSHPASNNAIDGCTISSNQAGVIFSAGSMRNVVTRNDIMWNRLGGVTIAPYQTGAPRENRVSANHFDENGVRPIVLNLTAEEPNSLARSVSCERVTGAPNGGISTPVITTAQLVGEEGDLRVVIRGRACPGEVVEVYQSYVTSVIREKSGELPRIRGGKAERETINNQRREMAMPSIGEFNYLGSANTTADGVFEVTFPLAVITPTVRDLANVDRNTDIWAREVLLGAKPTDRAFSAIAIDTAGNTSEMSVRRQVSR